MCASILKNVGPGEFGSRRFRESGFAFDKGEDDCPKSILIKTEASTAHILIIYLAGNCKNRSHSIRCPLREFLEGCRPPLHPACKGMSTRYFMSDISCHLRTYNMERWRVKLQAPNGEGKEDRGGKERRIWSVTETGDPPSSKMPHFDELEIFSYWPFRTCCDIKPFLFQESGFSNTAAFLNG